MPKKWPSTRGNSEYAIQFSFAEAVVVFGQQEVKVYREAFQVIRHATEKSCVFRCCYFESASC